MKVKELIEKLKELDQEMQIIKQDSDGHETYDIDKINKWQDPDTYVI